MSTGLSSSRIRTVLDLVESENRAATYREELMMITGLDFVSVPTRDADRAREFYGTTLGLTPDGKAQYEFWAGETCIVIWEPERVGMPFAPQQNGHIALHVDDVEASRTALESKGVVFTAPTIDTGVCHMAMFRDPDGNDLMLHHRYTPRD